MANTYPSFNLEMLNLVVAMCRGVDPGVPDILRRLGYVEHQIELEFGNSGEPSRNVRPEIITTSREQGHTLLWEWKSGGNLDEDQLRRYQSVTPEDLRARAYVSPEAARLLDVVLVVPARKAADCSTVLVGLGVSFPLLSKTQDAIYLSANQFAVAPLSEAFQEGVTLDCGALTLGYFPVDLESPGWVWAERLGQAFLQEMHRRTPRVDCEHLARSLFRTWGFLAASLKTPYLKKIATAVEDMARNELRGYIIRNRELKGIARAWDIVNNPLDASSENRTQQYQKLQGLLSTCIERLRDAEEPQDQMSLGLEEE
jgi:hypothetical protein